MGRNRASSKKAKFLDWIPGCWGPKIFKTFVMWKHKETDAKTCPEPMNYKGQRRNNSECNSDIPIGMSAQAKTHLRPTQKRTQVENELTDWD